MQRRAGCLREICDGLGRMATELETLQSPLRELLNHLTDVRFFRLVSAGLGGEPFETLWRRAAAAMPLTQEERDALCAPGAVLGRCDAMRACAELALARASLTARALSTSQLVPGNAGISTPGLAMCSAGAFQPSAL